MITVGAMDANQIITACFDLNDYNSNYEFH